MIFYSFFTWTMLKNNGKKAAVTAAGAAGLCLLLLLVAVQHHRVPRLEDEGAGDSHSPPAQRGEEAPQQPQREKRSFSAYFTKLARGRRDVEKPPRSSAEEPPPAEDLRPEDVFIAVKTTKKFHQSRLNVLLDTWISRNLQQVKINQPTNQSNREASGCRQADAETLLLAKFCFVSLLLRDVCHRLPVCWPSAPPSLSPSQQMPPPELHL